MPDIFSARLLLSLHVYPLSCVWARQSGAWRWPQWALPDPTWHGITAYLSHPVCLLLALQRPSNPRLSTFQPWFSKVTWRPDNGIPKNQHLTTYQGLWIVNSILILKLNMINQHQGLDHLDSIEFCHLSPLFQQYLWKQTYRRKRYFGKHNGLRDIRSLESSSFGSHCGCF